MAHLVQKQPVSVALRGRAAGPLWIAAAAALAAAAVMVVLLLAGGGERVSAPDEPGRAAQRLNLAAGIRYDGGPDEGTPGVVSPRTVEPTQGSRYDGGPEEGAADIAAPAAGDDSGLHGRGLTTDW
jgi:hypothetical protein